MELQDRFRPTLVTEWLSWVARVFVLICFCGHLLSALLTYFVWQAVSQAAGTGTAGGRPPIGLSLELEILLLLTVVSFVAWTASRYLESTALAARLPEKTEREIYRSFLPWRPRDPLKIINTIYRNVLGERRAASGAKMVFLWWLLVQASAVSHVVLVVLCTSQRQFGSGFVAMACIAQTVFAGITLGLTVMMMTSIETKLKERRAADARTAMERGRPPTPGRALRTQGHSSDRSIAPNDGNCVVCKAPVEEDRCSACGAAVVCEDYRIIGQLGRTNQARTYLAISQDGMRIALKELSFATAPSAQAIDAFEREGKLLETLIHPRIPRFVKAFASGEGIHLRLYLAQEYIPGQPLTARLQTGALPESEVVQLLRSVLEILQYLHERQPRVIHRDVKPSNIMCRLDGEIALIDFGAARTLGQTMMDATLVGTFGYMPPQQLAGQVDETTDLYALGATAMHLLSGRPPWELMSEELQLELPPNANVSPSLALFLRHMTAPQRRNRIQTAREALQLLDGTFRATG